MFFPCCGLGPTFWPGTFFFFDNFLPQRFQHPFFSLSPNSENFPGKEKEPPFSLLFEKGSPPPSFLHLPLHSQPPPPRRIAPAPIPPPSLNPYPPHSHPPQLPYPQLPLRICSPTPCPPARSRQPDGSPEATRWPPCDWKDSSPPYFPSHPPVSPHPPPSPPTNPTFLSTPPPPNQTPSRSSIAPSPLSSPLSVIPPIQKSISPLPFLTGRRSLFPGQCNLLGSFS